ncbi:MAG: hypothetical protein ACI9FB_002245 [Candidatus Azotimanducaceae bacterium]|jgi:hypothetical protein
MFGVYRDKLCFFLLSTMSLILITFSAWSAPAKHKVLPLLEGFEWELSVEDFQSLPDDTYLTLIEIASDPTLLAFYRGRAQVALSLYKNEKVWGYFENSIEGALSQSEKRRALEGICEVFIHTRSDALKDLLRPELQNEDIRFRVISAQCLRDLQAQESDPITDIALKQYEKSIIVDWERQQFKR